MSFTGAPSPRPLTPSLSELPSRLSTPSPAPPIAQKPMSEAALAKKALREETKRQKELERLKRREEKKEALAQGLAVPGVPSNVADVPLRFKPREWASVVRDGEGSSKGHEVKIMTWNMLAQALVRRELFPNSDFLKVKERIPTLMQEVLFYSPSIICLQEVDRLSDHLPSLSLKYDTKSYIGYREKPHGLLIAYRRDEFECAGENGFRLDEVPIFEPERGSPSFKEPAESGQGAGVDQSKDAGAHEKGRDQRSNSPTIHDAAYDPTTATSKAFRKACGVSRSTRNVGLLVALKFRNRAGGLIVGTTHLFWHPSHVYERLRQTGVLMREARRYRDEGGDGQWKDWEIVIAGDFNTQPNESTYRLLMGLPLDPVQEANIVRSSVVHQSIDKIHDPDFVPPPEAVKTHDIDDGDLSQHPDRIIKNCRPAVEADGLVGVSDLKKLFKDGAGKDEGKVRSAYGEIHGFLDAEKAQWYCSRLPEVQTGSGWKITEDAEVVKARMAGKWDERVRRGDFEPIYTNFTPLWRCTLDYIFLLPPGTPQSSPAPKFTSLLKMHPADDMGLGLPRKGVEPSDHVALGTVIEFP